MNDQALQQLVEKISIDSFNRTFNHQAYFNHRLKTTGGRYHLKSHDIDINPKLLENYDTLIGTIKHELCHYHLHVNGKSGKHSSKEFKQLLQQVGGLRFVPNKEPVQYKYVYECINCNQKYFRQRKMDLKKFGCGKCRSNLRLKTVADSL